MIEGQVGRLHVAALSKNMGDADAWDLVQDTLERALRRRPKVANDNALRAWLGVVMRNVHIDQKRAARNRVADIDPDVLPAPEATEEQTWRTTSIDEVAALVERLPPSSRDVFRLHMRGCSVAETARHLGISVMNVSGRLFRARRQLRRLLLEGRTTQPPERHAPTPDCGTGNMRGMSREQRPFCPIRL
jgi:RNA polymerase sigma-70 factor (ECF subfamily)